MKLSSKTFLVAGLAALTAAVSLSAQAAVNLGNLPLWFEAGQGQGEAANKFIAHGRDAEFSITPAGAEFTLRQADGHQAAVRMSFVGASAESRLAGDNALGGKINYLLGNDPAQWQTGVPTYGKIRLDQVYPGVNVVYYGNQQQLEYDFDLAAGVNPETIVIRFDGAEKLSVNPQGELVVQLDGGQIVQREPVAYQTISGMQHAVKVGYQIVDAQTAAFVVGNFDRTQPLVIDPVLGYSTFFGGNYGDTAWAIAINTNDDSVYIAGQTFSTAVSNTPPYLPFTKNGIFTNFSGGSILGDAFVAKIDSSGTNLVFATYLGGKGNNAAYAVAVDPWGNAYVAGATDTTNFPVTNSLSYGTYSGTNMHGVFNKTYGVYPLDAFVAKLSADGSALLYSSYLGGSSWDAAYAITVDTQGNAYVTGSTYSSNFPVTITTALRTNLACTNNFYTDYNAFVTEIASNGIALNYSTYLGGTNRDIGNAITYNNGRVFVAGSTLSTNFPWTNGLSACTNLNGFTNAAPASDAFVTMFSTAGTNLTLQYSTFLGSSNNDVATGIAADPEGNAYVVGWTTSTNFPDTTTTNSSLQLSSFIRTNATGLIYGTNAFLTQITWDGTKASNGFSRVFGGIGVDVANGVALDSAGNVFVVGSASSTNFPVTRSNLLGGLRFTNSSPNFGSPGGSDVFVIAFAAGFNNLLYSGYLGGNSDDFGYGIAVDSDGNAYVTGQTLSTNFPTLGTWSTNSAALHSYRDGTNDSFVAKILTTFAPPALNVKKTGTNVLVYWQSFSDVTPASLGLVTTTNLLMTVTNKVITTNNMMQRVTNLVEAYEGTTNWILVTNPAPVLTNTIAPTNNYYYIYTFNPTNQYRFFRFRNND